LLPEAVSVPILRGLDIHRWASKYAMTTKLLKGIIIAGWLGSMSWLAQTELLPRWLPGKATGYRSLIENAAEVRETWMRILSDGHPIGYSRTFYDLNDDVPDPELVMHNATNLRINLLGSEINLQITSTVTLDGGHRMKSFFFGTSLDGMMYRVSGTRTAGQSFDLSIKMPQQTEPITRKVTIPDDSIIFSPSIEMAMRRMKPGQTMRLNGYDPLTGGGSMLLIRAENYEDITISGKNVRCLRLVAEYGSMRFPLWTNEEGSVMRQETPFGWTMEVCTQQEALRGMDQSGAPPPLSMPGLPALLQMLTPSTL